MPEVRGALSATKYDLWGEVSLPHSLSGTTGSDPQAQPGRKTPLFGRADVEAGVRTLLGHRPGSATFTPMQSLGMPVLAGYLPSRLMTPRAFVCPLNLNRQRGTTMLSLQEELYERGLLSLPYTDRPGSVWRPTWPPDDLFYDESANEDRYDEDSFP